MPEYKTKIIAFDLDDTICTRPPDVEHLGADKYDLCQPDEAMVAVVKGCRAKGYKIVIYTARGMFTFDGDVEKIYEELYDKTVRQLRSWGVPFDELIMGKVPYDLLIDDKAMNAVEVWCVEDIEEFLGELDG